MNEQEFLIALEKIFNEKLDEKLEPIQDELARINIVLEHEVRDQLKLLRETQIQMHQEIKILQGVKDFSIEAGMKAAGAGFTAEKALDLAQSNEKRICELEQKVGT